MRVVSSNTETKTLSFSSSSSNDELTLKLYRTVVVRDLQEQQTQEQQTQEQETQDQETQEQQTLEQQNLVVETRVYAEVLLGQVDDPTLNELFFLLSQVVNELEDNDISRVRFSFPNKILIPLFKLKGEKRVFTNLIKKKIREIVPNDISEDVRVSKRTEDGLSSYQLKNMGLRLPQDYNITLSCSLSNFEKLYRSNLKNLITKRNVYVPKQGIPDDDGWITVDSSGKLSFV